MQVKPRAHAQNRGISGSMKRNYVLQKFIFKKSLNKSKSKAQHFCSSEIGKWNYYPCGSMIGVTLFYDGYQSSNTTIRQS